MYAVVYIYHSGDSIHHDKIIPVQVFVRRRRQVRPQEEKYWKHVAVGHMTEEERDDDDSFICHKITWRSEGNCRIWHSNINILYTSLFQTTTGSSGHLMREL